MAPRNGKVPAPREPETHVPIRDYIEMLSTQLHSEIRALDGLTEAKFVTYRTLIDSQAEKVALALTAADKAVNKAEVDTNNRLALLNELRNDVATKASMDALADRFNDLKERVDKIEGRSGGIQSGFGWMIAAVVALSGVINLAIYALTKTS